MGFVRNFDLGETRQAAGMELYNWWNSTVASFRNAEGFSQAFDAGYSAGFAVGEFVGPPSAAVGAALRLAGRLGRWARLGRARAADYASHGLPSSGFSHTDSAILDAFRGKKHTDTTRDFLRALDSSEARPALRFDPSLDVAGRIEGGVIHINSTMNIDDILATLAHEAQHYLDIARNVIPARNRGGVKALFAELRAWNAGHEFASLNGLTRAYQYQRVQGVPLKHLAASIADSYATRWGGR